MNKKRIWSTFKIALQNLKKQSFRTGFMIFFVVLQTFTLLFSSILMTNMKRGIENTVDRVGADVIVIPEGDTELVQNSLFMGKICTIYFDEEWVDKIANVEGVKRVTPQRFLETQQASCCDQAVQMIAIDPETDFLIKPWFEKEKGIALTDDEIVIGANVQAGPGDTLTFYHTDFKVKEKLETTGMGYDNSVFMNMKTADKLNESADAKNLLHLDSKTGQISMVMIEVEEGESPEKVAMRIKNTYSDSPIESFTSNRLFRTIFENVKKFTSYSMILEILLFTATAFALISIFQITINERRKEFGILYTIGAKKHHVSSIIINEAMVISVIGCIVGALLSISMIAAFKNPIRVKFDIPYFDIIGGELWIILLKCLVLSVITGLAASFWSVWNISKEEPYVLIREKE